jgi:signal transduction histidine kinase
LTQLAATLDGLLDRLAASLRREQRFSAELSHELRTPLANVMAEAQFALRHAAGSEEYRAGFAQILQSATQMSRTLETLMAAARAELNPGRTTSDATAAARAAAEACARVAAERGVDITIDGPPTRVAVDAELVERVLAPLLENACRYGRSTVRVSVATAGNQVVCAVDDDGPGVAPEDRELIFEPGRRGSAAGGRNGNADGAGLGLALARRLARAGDGEVELDEHGSGGRFIVRLPAA